ncbi:MAG: heavy-metal-associated domain-containing protein [Chitinophagales bacterium]
MKNSKIKIFATAVVLFFVTNIFSQSNTIASVQIPTSAVCGMCKKTIEAELSKVTGVKVAIVNLDSKDVTVRYNTEKTSEAEIKQAIAAIGYDAGDVPADEKAYDDLHACCKKE